MGKETVKDVVDILVGKETVKEVVGILIYLFLICVLGRENCRREG